MTKDKHKNRYGWAWGLGSVITFALSAGAAWILYSKHYIDHHARLRLVWDAEQGRFSSEQAGEINYYVYQRSEKRPLLILHDLHNAGGVHDISPMLEAFSSKRACYAMDLPGFGNSEKSDRPYRPSLYKEAIRSFISQKIGQTTDTLAFGLSCEFAAMLVSENPHLVNSLVMINPSGFQMPTATIVGEHENLETVRNWAYSMSRVPLWNLPLHDACASRVAIHRYYRQRFAYSNPGELVDLAYASAHQPGSNFAATALRSGQLSTPDIREKAYDDLQLPVLVLYDSVPGRSYDMLPQHIRSHNNWKALRLRQSCGMPQWEARAELNRLLEDFWDQHPIS